MKKILVLNIILVFLVTFSNCESLIRRKRFLSSLWPSAKPKSVNNEVVYLHLPPEYIEAMHNELQSRSDASQKEAMDVKIMEILKPDGQSQNPKIIMKSILPRPDVKIHELPLPEIHTTHKFVTPTPFPKTVTEKSEVPIYSEHQSLPIKRVYDNSVVSLPSIKNSDISEFYHTQEFNDLLKEFKLKVDIKSLPEIQDVLTILGTDDAEETLRAIREVAETPEGLELITSYLKGNDRTEEDEFYNIYEDVGAGEIRVSDDDFSKNYIQPYTNEILQSDDASQYNYSPVENPINATPETLSWWQKPLSWFGFYNDVKTVKTEKIKSDAEIIAKVVHDPDGLGGLSYTTKFLNPMGHRKEHEIDPPFKISGNEEGRLISSEPFESPSTLPTIQMSEEDFERMIKELRLSPINPQTTTEQPRSILTTNEASTTTQLPPIIFETIATTQQPLFIAEATTKEVENFETSPAEESKEINYEATSSENIVSQSFELPINVAETFNIDIPDPQIPQKVNTVTEQLETTRRSFEVVSGPVRLSPIESRTGKVYRVDPEEVLKETKSIAVDFEGGFI